MFKVGQDYTRDEIHQRVGGSKETYLPMLNGDVVAACLTKDYNPLAPHVILCGDGRDIARFGARLAMQTAPVPVFMKRAVNRWEFLGYFKSRASFTSEPLFERLIEGSGRTDVTRAVILEEVSAS